MNDSMPHPDTTAQSAPTQILATARARNRVINADLEAATAALEEGRLTEEQYSALVGPLIEERAQLGRIASRAVEGCPSWCRDHTIFLPDADGEPEVGLHAVQVRVGRGLIVEVTQSADGVQPPTLSIDTFGHELELPQAVELARAVSELCERVTPA